MNGIRIKIEDVQISVVFLCIFCVLGTMRHEKSWWVLLTPWQPSGLAGLNKRRDLHLNFPEVAGHVKFPITLFSTVDNRP
jgi:hypothetical protein